MPMIDLGLTPQFGREKYTGENRVRAACRPGGGLKHRNDQRKA